MNNKKHSKLYNRLTKVISSVVMVAAMAINVGQAHATTINVTSGDDTTVNGNCTLREAITSLNRGPAGPAVDSCLVANGINDKIYIGNTFSIVRTMPASLPPILKNVVIEGAGYLLSYIDGNFGNFTFRIGDDASSKPIVKIRALTIQNFAGSAVQVLTGSQVTVEYARIWDSGGTTTGNDLIYTSAGSTLTLSNVEIDNASSFFAIINNSGSLKMNYTTLRDSNGQRSVITNFGTATIVSSTIANNTARLNGGAVFTFTGAVTTIDGSTIAYNTSGAACNFNDSCSTLQTFDTGSITIKNSILSNNVGSGKAENWACSGNIKSGGYNIYFGKDANNLPPTGCQKTATDRIIDPKLIASNRSPIDNGGVGATYMPDPTSPAISAVPSSNAFCTGLLSSYDQRGIVRGKSVTACDIGAVERATALLVKNTAGTEKEQWHDDAFAIHLKNLGFEVTSIDHKSGNIASFAAGKHLVLISESVTTAEIADKFLNVPNTVIVNEPDLYPKMRMTGVTSGTDFGDATNQMGITLQSIAIGDLSGTYPNGPRSFSIASPVGWGIPNANAIRHAFVQNSTTKAAIFQYSKGQLMLGNFVAPGARFGYFLQPGTSSGDDGRLIRNFFLVAASAR